MDIRMNRLEWLSAELLKEVNRIETSYDIKKMEKQRAIDAHYGYVKYIHQRNYEFNNSLDFKQWYDKTYRDDEQAMIDYNAMEEEWEMDNYNEMKDE